MPRKLRSNEIDLTQARVYHVVSRCVRAIRLLKADDDSRKELCMQYLELLSENTAVGVVGFSLMDNHLHLLLRVDVERGEGWTDEEVASRWLKLHPVRNGYFQPVEPTENQIGELVDEDGWVQATREKLCNISQFMKELKQRIAQAANRQDGVTGAFWEGRYKVTGVHDEAQLLATMAYIDLNPFSANACKTPEEGRYTSLQGRLDRDTPLRVNEVRPGYESRGQKEDSVRSVRNKPGGRTALVSKKGRQQHQGVAEVRSPCCTWLLPMDREYRSQRRSKTAGTGRKRKRQRQVVLPGLTIRVYLRLVDHVARLMRAGKKRLANEVKPILRRLSLTSDTMMDAIMNLRRQWQPYLSDGAGIA